MTCSVRCSRQCGALLNLIFIGLAFRSVGTGSERRQRQDGQRCHRRPPTACCRAFMAAGGGGGFLVVRSWLLLGLVVQVLGASGTLGRSAGRARTARCPEQVRNDSQLVLTQLRSVILVVHRQVRSLIGGLRDPGSAVGRSQSRYGEMIINGERMRWRWRVVPGLPFTPTWPQRSPAFAVPVADLGDRGHVDGVVDAPVPVSVRWVLDLAGSMGCRHHGAQDVHDVAAGFAGGVDVAADVEAVLGDVLAGEPPRGFLLVFTGRTPRSLMLFAGQILVSSQNRVTSACRSRQNSSRSRPGCWAVVFFGPGTRGTFEHPARTAWRNSCSSGYRMPGGISGWPVPRPACQARIRPRSARCA